MHAHTCRCKRVAPAKALQERKHSFDTEVITLMEVDDHRKATRGRGPVYLASHMKNISVPDARVEWRMLVVVMLVIAFRHNWWRGFSAIASDCGPTTFAFDGTHNLRFRSEKPWSSSSAVSYRAYKGMRLCRMKKSLSKPTCHCQILELILTQLKRKISTESTRAQTTPLCLQPLDWRTLF